MSSRAIEAIQERANEATSVERWWNIYNSDVRMMSPVLLSLASEEQLKVEADISFCMSTILAGFDLIATKSQQQDEKGAIMRRLPKKEFYFGTEELGGVFRAEQVTLTCDTQYITTISVLQIFDIKNQLVLSVRMLPQHNLLSGEYNQPLILTDRFGALYWLSLTLVKLLCCKYYQVIAYKP